jgi:NADP-dependent 3-hydroxy acid dehydrogenase YdfG
MLEGRIALVTGASSGIGEATARALYAQGAALVVAARRREQLDALVRELDPQGGRTLAVACDLSEAAAADALVAGALARFGRVDILVNNAGVMHLGLIDGGNVAEWRTMLDLNLLAPMLLTRAVLPGMKAQGGGHIVNVSSVAGRIIVLGSGLYNVTKWGLNVFSEALRQEVSPLKIRVTAVEPGVVETELLDRIGDPERRASFRKWADSMETLQPVDIANAVVYAVTQPARVNVNEILVRPTAQER